MSYTIPALLTAKLIAANISRLGKALNPKGPTMTLLHDTAMQTLLHAQQHGDVTLCQRLFEAVGGDTGSIRGGAMKAWMAAHAPITAIKGKWSMKKGWKATDFKIEEAGSKPFWEWAGAEKATTITGASIFNVIKGLLKRVDNAVEKGTFKGDPVAVKDALNNVVSFSAAAEAKLSLAQKGEVDETAEVILAAATDGGTSMSEAAPVAEVA